jgi:iron complex transport system substrate-binding protein
MGKTIKRPMGAALAALALAVCVALVMGLAGCSTGNKSADSDSAGSAASSQGADENATRIFTDSLGREVEVPANITKVAPSGHTANQVLLTMAPEKMSSVSQALSDDQKKIFAGRVADDLPVTGAAFGAKGDMNKEAVAESGAQIVIDTGEPKDGLAEDLDNLQDQLGIPVVFVNTPLNDWGSAYRMLGDLLGDQQRGEKLATYCDNAYAEVAAAMAKVPSDQRVKAAYLLGNNGLNAIAKGSYQGTVIDMIADNVVRVEKASGSGAGNEISMEQLAQWDPQLIVFGAGASSSDSFYASVAGDPAWASLSAVQNGQYYNVPSVPWTWLNNPPTVNQVLGMQWFVRLCYPDQFSNDMEQVVKDYFQTFYGYSLSDAEYQQITANALPKK